MNKPDHESTQTMLFSRQHSLAWQLFLTISLLFGYPALCFSEETMSENPAKQLSSETSAVARAVFTSQIVDREPVDSLSELSNNSDRIYFFTDLRGLTGQIVTHRWEHEGQIMAEIKFKVGNGPRWRVYSSKNLLPTWTGQWTVSVVDEHGTSLNVSTFNYVVASTADDATPGNQ